MRKTFICLANSKKYGGRCLAGIEIERNPTDRHLELCRDPQGRPRWVRPVSRTEHGEIPHTQSQHLQLLDFEAQAPCPDGCQTENVWYAGKIFEKSGFLNLKPPNLDQLADDRPTLLGNLEKSVSMAEAAVLDHSIALIKPELPSVRFHEIGATHLRVMFGYRATRFDLPVTDFDFYLRWVDEPQLLAAAGHIYFCVSVSKEYEGRLHKLVAGILWA